MKPGKNPSIFSSRILVLASLLAFSFAGIDARAQHSRHGVVPLHKIPSGQWVEKVWGDPASPGVSFVIRIHNDANYIILPHTHPIDENIAVVQGVMSLGMGSRFNRSALEQLGVGGFAFVPKNMAHFGWSKTETIIQVHGIGPFSSNLVDPVYELTDKGIFLLTSLLQPGTPTESSPSDCFALKIGARVHGGIGEGTVVGARCSHANQLTQYWVQQPNGERFWATLKELKSM